MREEDDGRGSEERMETHLLPPRYTLLTKDTLLGDGREMFKTFRPNPDGSRRVLVKSSPLVPGTDGKHALWLYEKYAADKGQKPDRISGVEVSTRSAARAKYALAAHGSDAPTESPLPSLSLQVGKCDATCITEIVAAEHEERKRANGGKDAKKWLMVVADEAHFMRNQTAFWCALRTVHCSSPLPQALPVPAALAPTTHAH